jgi:hypothetical protein
MEHGVSLIAEVLFAKTARLFLRLFGVRSAPKWVEIILGLILWIFIGIVVVVLVKKA